MSIEKQVMYTIFSWAEDKRILKAILDSIEKTIICCRKLGLECRDPPVLTTGSLYSLGYHQYFVRMFWDKLPLGTYVIPLYKQSGFIFNMEIQHDIASTYETTCNNMIVPIDFIDARKTYSTHAPHTHRLFLRISGAAGGNVIKVNLLRILYLIESSKPKTVFRLLDILRKIVYGEEEKQNVLSIAIELIRNWENYLEFIVPQVPASREELRKMSPLLRWMRI